MSGYYYIHITAAPKDMSKPIGIEREEKMCFGPYCSSTYIAAAKKEVLSAAKKLFIDPERYTFEAEIRYFLSTDTSLKAQEPASPSKVVEPVCVTPVAAAPTPCHSDLVLRVRALEQAMIQKEQQVSTLQAEMRVQQELACQTVRHEKDLKERLQKLEQYVASQKAQELASQKKAQVQATASFAPTPVPPGPYERLVLEQLRKLKEEDFQELECALGCLEDERGDVRPAAVQFVEYLSQLREQLRELGYGAGAGR